MTLVKLSSGAIIRFEEIESLSSNGKMWQLKMEGNFSPYITEEEYNTLSRFMPTLLEHIAFLSRQDTGPCAMTLDDGTIIMSREIEAVIHLGSHQDAGTGEISPARFIVTKSLHHYRITEEEYRHFAGFQQHPKERNRSGTAYSTPTDDLPDPH